MTIVSVIVPVFNRSFFIKETLESVVVQDFSDIELIVIDDGSTDGSYDLLLDLQKEHNFIMLIHPGRVNRGQSASINLGLKSCTGDYVAILDSDDLFLQGKISSQVKFLDEHPDVGLVYGKGQVIDSSGRFLYDLHDDNHLEKNDPNEMLLDCYFLLPQNSLVRKSVYDQVGMFDENLRSGQDHDMLVRMSEVSRFHFKPDLVFKYRSHPDSISVKGQEVRWRAAFVILDKAKKRYHYKSKTVRKRRAVINFRLAKALLLYKKNRAEAIWRLLWAGLLDPIRGIRVLLGIDKSS